MWKVYALLSALFAALTAIFAKVGVKDVNSDLATAIRTSVILVLTWGIVLFGQHVSEIREVGKNSANRMQKARFMLRCSLLPQILFAKIAIIAE